MTSPGNLDCRLDFEGRQHPALRLRRRCRPSRGLRRARPGFPGHVGGRRAIGRQTHRRVRRYRPGNDPNLRGALQVICVQGAEMAAKERVRVVVVDDHPIMRDGLRDALGGRGVAAALHGMHTGRQATSRRRFCLPYRMVGRGIPNCELLAGWSRYRRPSAPAMH